MIAFPVRPRRTFPRRHGRGSILIVAMLISAVIALSLGSYIALSRSSLKLANRSFYNTGAMNIAETGIEEALWSFNQATAGVALATAWQGWDISDGVSAKRTFTDFTLSGNNQAAVKVYVDHYNPAASTQPIAVAQSTITLPNDARTLSKTIEVKLRRRSKFAMGLVAKNQITFNGNNASVDSWNSDPDNNPGTAAIPYSAGVKNDRGSVGSTSVAVGSVAINNADIWGFASVGSSSASALSVGTNGTIAAFGSPAGTVDTTRVATDFTANFDPVNDPAGGSTLGPIGATLGSAGVTATYRFGGTISSDLTIYGHVTLVLTALPGTNAINLTGGDGLTLAANSTLVIYTAADVKIAGARHHPPPHYRVAEQMTKFLRWYHTAAGTLHPVARAAAVHTRFVLIHPFIDGNGRTARLLLNLELLKSGYWPVVLPVEARLRYYEALDAAWDNEQPGDLTPITDLIAEYIEQGLGELVAFLNGVRVLVQYDSV